MAKPEVRKSRKVVDVKAAAANDTVVTQAVELAEAVVAREVAEAAVVAKPMPTSATGLGAYFAGLAGRPSKPTVIYAFGKTGYALSWQARAVKLGITTEELCERFVKDREQLKLDYAAATEKKPKA